MDVSPECSKLLSQTPFLPPNYKFSQEKITLVFFHVGSCNFLILISLSQRMKEKKNNFSKHSKKSAYSSMRLCKSLLKQRPDVTRSLQGCKRWHRWVTSPKETLEKAAPPPRVHPAIWQFLFWPKTVQESWFDQLLQALHPLGWKQCKKICTRSFYWHRAKGFQLQA